MKKLVAYFIAFIVALLCAAVILSPAVAGAEDNIISYFAVVDDTKLSVFNGKVCWETKVYIPETGELLSYFDDGKLRTGTPLQIKVFNGDEIIDVEYLPDIRTTIITITGIVLLVAFIVTLVTKAHKHCK